MRGATVQEQRTIYNYQDKRRELHVHRTLYNMDIGQRRFSLVFGVEFLHVPVPLHLGLIPVDTTFHLHDSSMIHKKHPK